MSGPKLAPVPKPIITCSPATRAKLGLSAASPMPAAMTSAAMISATVIPKRSITRPTAKLPRAKPSMVIV